MGKLNSLMQLMIYIHYWLLFFNIDNFKYTITSQRRSFNSFSLSSIFYVIDFFYYLFSKCHAQKIFTSIIYIMYRILWVFCYVMYYIVSKISIGGRFFEDCFYCYFQQFISTAAAKEFQIPYNLTKRAPETSKSNQNQIKKI